METTYDADTLYRVTDERGHWSVAAGRDLLDDESIARDCTVRVATRAEARAEGWLAGWTCIDGVTTDENWE